MSFTEMQLDEGILKALNDLSFKDPTEIQAKTITLILKGHDVIGQSMTGSGKTLAFGAPILHHFQQGRGIQALIIAPTRELANQIAQELEKFSKYKRSRVVTVFGGVSIEPQIAGLGRADIVVGTPGRILDHIQRRTIDLRHVKTLVLDEADRMLDMGFIDDIRDILKNVPRERQTLLFSATMPPVIENLAHRFMKDPIRIRTQSLVSKTKMKQYYYDVLEGDKLSLLVHLMKKEKPELAIVFCNTKRETDFVAQVLERNEVEARAIHGDLSQAARMQVLESFHRGKIHVLVATDVAARGLDIKNVTHIFNYDLPNDAENYTHRIGRTARIGKEGKVLSLLCSNDHEAFRRIIRTHDIEKIVEKDYPKIRAERPHYRRSFSGGRFGSRRRY